MTPLTKRTRIGRNNNIATRQVVYRTPQGLEVDELDHFEIIRKRVFYEDVLLVTHHRQRSVAGVITLAILFLILTVVAASVRSVPVLAAILASAAGVALLFIVVRLLMPIDVITVFGRRSKAAVRYYYRKELARRTYGEICANVAAAQRSLARDIAATEPPEESVANEEMPPMPEAL